MFSNFGHGRPASSAQSAQPAKSGKRPARHRDWLPAATNRVCRPGRLPAGSLQLPTPKRHAPVRCRTECL